MRLCLGAIAASSWCFLEPRTSDQNADEKLNVFEVSKRDEEGSLQQRCDISSLHFSPLSNFCLGCSLPFGRLTLEMTFLLMSLSLSQGARVPLSSWILNQKPASAHRLLSQIVPFGSSNNQHPFWYECRVKEVAPCYLEHRTQVMAAAPSVPWRLVQKERKWRNGGFSHSVCLFLHYTINLHKQDMFSVTD